MSVLKCSSAVLSNTNIIPTEIRSSLYRASLSLEAPNYCLCIQSKSAGFSFVNTGKQVHLKHARRHFERNLVKDVHHRSFCIQKLVRKLETRGSRSNACRLLSLAAYWRAKCTKIHPAQSDNSKTLYAKRFKPSTSTLWENYSRIWRNAFKCAWMWKETSFSVDYERVLFCIVPGMCIYIFKSLSQ